MCIAVLWCFTSSAPYKKICLNKISGRIDCQCLYTNTHPGWNQAMKCKCSGIYKNNTELVPSLMRFSMKTFRWSQRTASASVMTPSSSCSYASTISIFLLPSRNSRDSGSKPWETKYPIWSLFYIWIVNFFLTISARRSYSHVSLEWTKINCCLYSRVKKNEFL